MKTFPFHRLILALLALLAAAGLPAATQAFPSQQSEPTALTPAALANMSYRSELGAEGVVTLVDGRFEESETGWVAGIRAATLATGTLDGQPVAAVQFFESGGGSGLFVSLALVVEQEGLPVNLASAPLGDRVQVNTLTVADDQIQVELVRHGEGDPMCCPTELVNLTYAWEDNQLVPVAEVVLGRAPLLSLDLEIPYQRTVLPSQPYTASQLSGDLPVYTELLFDESTEAPTLALYPVEEALRVWEEAGDLTGSEQLAALQRILAEQPASLNAPLPPPATGEAVEGQVAYLSGDGFSGVRFVAELDDASLIYHFSGLSDDGRYWVAAQRPVEAAATADDSWQLSELDAIVEALSIQLPATTELETLSYPSLLLERPVLLKNGLYTETVVADDGIASTTTLFLLEEPRAFGQFEGLDATLAVLGENGGGTGNFLSLVLLQKIEDELVATASIFLGDRPQVLAAAFDPADRIRLDLIQVGANDAFCCPTMPMSLTLVKVGDRLMVERTVAATLDSTSVADKGAFAESIQAAVVPATAYDNTLPPLNGQGLPKHFVWTFGTADLGVPAQQASNGYVAVYPVAAYRQIWQEAGDLTVEEALAALEGLLAERPASPPPVLPQQNASNDFAAQIRYLDRADGGAGVRFVGRFAQDLSPVENTQLRYVFQGLSGDGEFLIVAMLPVTTTALPAAPQELDATAYAEFADSYATYLTELTTTFDSLPSTDFSPDLAALDELLLSVAPAAESNPLAPAALANLAFNSELTLDGRALLADGVYTESIDGESASWIEVRLLADPIAYNTLDGQEAAAAILTESSGGSGIFVSLALVLLSEGEATHVASAPLGDRVQVQALTFDDNGQIEVSLLVQGPDDPLCCPSQPLNQRYAWQEGTLLLVEEVAGPTESAESAPDGGADALPGTAWAWQGTAYGNDTVVAPVDPTRYVIEFGTDGTVNVQDDCNQLGGVYSVAGDTELIIELQTSTMAACAPESLHDQFILDLSGVASYLFEEGRLYVALRYDTGIMEFAPAE